jgi:hypothetical protein
LADAHEFSPALAIPKHFSLGCLAATSAACAEAVAQAASTAAVTNDVILGLVVIAVSPFGLDRYLLFKCSYFRFGHFSYGCRKVVLRF